MPGPVDDAHAAAAQHLVDFIAGDPGQLGRGRRSTAGRRVELERRRREQRIQFGVAGELRRQRSRTCGSNSGQSRHTSSGVRPESRISSSSCSNARIIGHRSPACTRMALETDGSGAARIELVAGGSWPGAGRPVPPPATAGPIQTPLHRLDRDAQHLGGLDVGQPLDAHQAEDLALVLRQVVDRLQHPAAVRGDAGIAAGRGGHKPFAQFHGGGLFI